MIACYDLSRCPPTYDVVAFLAHAELERLRRREDHIDVHILPGPQGGFRRDTLWPHSIAERRQLLENVVLPMCRLLPSVREVVVEDRRESVDGWGKGDYLISLPAIMSALRQGSRPLRANTPEPIAHDGPYITFTLREAEHHPLRNSRVAEWVRAANVLRLRGHQVAVMRDAAKAEAPPIDNLQPSAVASTRLDLRAGAYARASLNVGICNGPMWMSIFMGAPTLMLRPTTNEAGGCYDDAFYARWGLPRGSQLPTSPPSQRLVWEEDTCDNIVRAVESMLALKEAT